MQEVEHNAVKNLAKNVSGIIACQYVLHGCVQGVGFRPFVYRLASQLKIKGWVSNGMGQVIIHAEATNNNLREFINKLITEAPPAATPALRKKTSVTCQNYSHFIIRESDAAAIHDIHIPADLPLCDNCRTELHDINNRRYSYPFINCTQCGPRYTIIEQLPYDRCNTSMKGFHLCADCQKEYNNPSDRRFHAEPLACATCGPKLTYQENTKTLAIQNEVIIKCAHDLLAGLIIAVKGIGGYHILCDATNEKTINELRNRKQRPDKPFAVMFPYAGKDGLDAVSRYVVLSDAEKHCLTDNAYPIVLARRSADCELADKLTPKLAPNLAPGLNELGVMLAYSPLHDLLLKMTNRPLLATSANISGEPVLTDSTEVVQRLDRICDRFLHHDRPILRPADDPVYRQTNNLPRPLRPGRGNAPLEMKLPLRLTRPLLATGGHMKNTIALAWEDRIVISPHIGDLGSLRSQEVFKQVIEDLQQLYRIRPEHVLCDAHPDYASHRWAMAQKKASGFTVNSIYHHYAHASALAGEYPQPQQWLVFTWDGTGLGDDGSLWGGEALYGSPGQWQRAGSFRQFKLSGGDRAAREPWRSALALLWQSQHKAALKYTPDVLDKESYAMLEQAWQQDINTLISSSAGRLFDAAAAILGINHTSSYEGQAPMLLEALASGNSSTAVNLPIAADKNNILRIDWSPLLDMLFDAQLSVAERAHCLHNSLATALVQQACQIRDQVREIEKDDMAIGLTGGVFQNKLLTENIIHQLKQKNFRVYLPQQIPLNDAGLCYGQVIEAAARYPDLTESQE